ARAGHARPGRTPRPGPSRSLGLLRTPVSSSSVADTGQREAYTGAGTLACLVRRALLSALFAAAVLAAPGPASAAPTLPPCKTNGVLCATVDVPLDRGGAVPGTIGLHVEVLPASGQQR